MPTVRCPACAARLTMSEEQFLKRIRCNTCSMEFFPGGVGFAGGATAAPKSKPKAKSQPKPAVVKKPVTVNEPPPPPASAPPTPARPKSNPKLPSIADDEWEDDGEYVA